MKTNQFIYKTMSAVMITAAIILGATSTFAQVKIGANPTVIGASNNLEVEASTTGRKTSIDKVTGKITIADGSQGIDKVLTSDANGMGTWQTQSVGCASFEATGNPQNVLIYDANGFPDVNIIAGNELYDPQSAYNNTTGQYTVPSTGVYIFRASGGDYILTNSATRGTNISINSAQKGQLANAGSGAIYYGTATWNTISSINYLTAGDIITFGANVVHATGTKPAATTLFDKIKFSGTRIDCTKN